MEKYEPKKDYTPAICPLCDNYLDYFFRDGTHIYKCGECPFVGFEYVTRENLAEFILSLK